MKDVPFKLSSLRILQLHDGDFYCRAMREAKPMNFVLIVVACAEDGAVDLSTLGSSNGACLFQAPRPGGLTMSLTRHTLPSSGCFCVISTPLAK